MARTRTSLAARAGRAVRGARNGVRNGFNSLFRRGKGRAKRVQQHADTMTLQEHMEEFRSRLVKTMIGIAFGTVVGFVFAGTVINWMTNEAIKISSKTIFTTIEPAEGFSTYFKIALYIGIIVASPIIFYQIVRFLAPGLMPHELKYLLWGIPVVSVLFLAGVVFANLLVIPRFLEFLIVFTESLGFSFTPSTSNYLTFFIRLSLGMGIVFQIPAALFLLAKVRVVDVAKLRKWRKFAFLICAIASAAIVPTPDPFNMFIVLVPMYALYELGTVMSYFALPAGERGKLLTLPKLKARS